MGPVIEEAPAASAEVRWCFERYYAELDARFEGGFDVAAALPLGLEELTPPAGLVLLARQDGHPVGCGALKLGDPESAEVKRVWVAPEARGQGLGGRLMDELERRAVEAGKRRARLETNRALHEAQAMYRARGYREVAPFNEERFADHWFEKELDAPLAAYLAAVPEAARPALDAVRAVIRGVAPAARETITYGIPTFVVEGRSVVHVAAWKRHLSLYPVPGADAALQGDMQPYRSGRGTLRFELDRPLPLDLVRRVVERLAVERIGVERPANRDRADAPRQDVREGGPGHGSPHRA
jgi:uncharacterized protein YdhG (YjbR/CyaY superfamily)/GNAT superfamily N-acetyltransferase